MSSHCTTKTKVTKVRTEPKNVHTVDINASTTLPPPCHWSDKLSITFETWHAQQTYSHFIITILFLLVPIQPHSVMHVPVGHTCNCGTRLWSVGNCISPLSFLWINIFAFAFILKCCIYYIALHLITLMLLTFLTYVHDLLAYLYILQVSLHPLLAHHYLCYENDCYNVLYTI